MPYRLRMVGGPNGSGESYLTKVIQEQYSIRMENYVNADDIEAALHSKQSFDFAPYSIKANTETLQAFYDAHPLGKETGLLKVERNRLRLTDAMPPMGYVGAVVADFIRRAMMAEGANFSFETVMSGRDKIALLQEAKDLGYKIYLYYVCTADPIINMARVIERVAEGGHDVPEHLIVKRWTNSLENLLPAIRLAHRAYLFDNSGTGHEVIAESFRGDLKFNVSRTTGWFRQFVLRKIEAE